jgi:hypothetical protein
MNYAGLLPELFHDIAHRKFATQRGCDGYVDYALAESGVKNVRARRARAPPPPGAAAARRRRRRPRAAAAAGAGSAFEQGSRAPRA